jgi:single-strand DNA-binding protein
MASRGLNKVMLIGNLGADPEMRYTPSGKAVTTFRIAVNRTWKDQSSGEQQQDTQWIRIVAWTQLAEICARYLSKGRSVYVEGRLQTRSWDAQDGSKRYMTEVVAQDVIILDRAPGAAAPEVEAGPADLGEGFGEGPTGEELPF